jgi:hypothetical protein
VVLLATAVCTAPFFFPGVPNTPTDVHINLVDRALSGVLFWQHGIYGRVPQVLSGIEPWSSGLYSLKLGSLFMNLAASSTAMTAVLFARYLVFIGLLSIVLSLRYGASFVLCVALASCALVGLNVLNWIFYWPDYFAGGAFGWAYPMFPVLLIPLAVEARMRRLAMLVSLSFVAGVFYGWSSTYAVVVFGSFVAAVWMVVEIGNVRGLAVAAANAVGVALAVVPELVRFLQIGVGGDRSKWAQLFDWTQTAQILLHRDSKGLLAPLAWVLVGLAVAMGIFHPKDRIVLVKLAIVYLIAMMLDPVMKSAGPSLEGRAGDRPVDVVLFLCLRPGRVGGVPVCGVSSSAGDQDVALVGGADVDCTAADLGQRHGASRESDARFLGRAGGGGRVEGK